MDKKLIYFVNNNLCTKYGINFNYSTMTESFNLHLHDFYELEIGSAGIMRGYTADVLNVLTVIALKYQREMFIY